jgi:hypothetical protein
MSGDQGKVGDQGKAEDQEGPPEFLAKKFLDRRELARERGEG